MLYALKHHTGGSIDMDSDVYMHTCMCACMCERKITHDMYIYNITKSKLNNDYYYNGRIVIQWQM